MHTAVSEVLAAPVRTRALQRIRDNALIIVGRTHVDLTAALLGTLATVRLSGAGGAQADVWARISRASGVDTALAAVSELVSLLGAAGTTLPVSTEPHTLLPASA